MKRSEALSLIRHCGYIGDSAQAGLIAAQKGIGVNLARKNFVSGEKARTKKWPCDCTKCKAERGEK